MALITGTGALVVAFGKVHDIEFENTGGLQVSGGVPTQVRGCLFEPQEGDAGITKTSGGALLVNDCWFEGPGIGIAADSGVADFLTVTDCHFLDHEHAIVTVGTLNQEVVIANNFFFNTEEAAVELAGALHSVVEGNTFVACGNQLDNAGGVVTIDTNSLQVVVGGNVFQDVGACPAVRSAGDDTTVVGNTCEGDDATTPASMLMFDGVRALVVANNIVNNHVNGITGGHGIQIVSCSDGVVQGNQLRNVGADITNTYDFINLTTSDRVLVIGNHLDPELDVGQIRYGINVVSGNNNAVYANFLGDSSDYGTADSADTATGTQTSPAAGAIGGQFAF